MKLRNNLLIITLFNMISLTASADGTQSIKVTFNGTDNTNWKVSNGGTSTKITTPTK